MKKNLFPDGEIFDGKHFNIHQDWWIPIPGFFIMASKRKIRSIAEFTDEESLEFMMILKKTRIGLSEILNIDDVYIFQNEDTQHGFHLWIFPRHEWMKKFGIKIESVRPIMVHAEKNLQTDEMMKQVNDAVLKMREFMN